MIWSGSTPHRCFANKTQSNEQIHIQQSEFTHPRCQSSIQPQHQNVAKLRSTPPTDHRQTTDRPPTDHRQTTGKTICRCKSNQQPMSQPTTRPPIMSSPIMSSPKPTLQKYHVYHQTQNHPDHGQLEYKMPALKSAEAMTTTPVSRWLD